MKVISNLSYTLTSNIVALGSSILIVLVLPRVLGVQEYGYWQLYLFYTTYVGLLHLGWNDGIYLRYGGDSYNSLDKRLFFSQFYMFVILQFGMSNIILITANLLNFNEDRMFIVQMTAICLFIMNVRNMPLYILQATNRIKEYAFATIIGKLITLSLVVGFVFSGIQEYKLLIAADLLGKIISLGYALYTCRDFVFLRVKQFHLSFKEAYRNIITGANLLVANISSLLVIGSVRFGIERSWGIEVFGKVSLVLSLSNLLMIFINAIGIVVFPVLRRSKIEKLPGIYITIKDLLMPLLLGALILFYPFKFFLSVWLPAYNDVLIYIALLLPICVYEGKMSLLINTYLKTIRKENLILKINLVTLIMAVIITYITTELLGNLNIAVLSIFFVLAFRCVVAEVILARILEIEVYKDTLIELLISIFFVCIHWFLSSWNSMFMYLIIYTLYIFYKRSDLINSIRYFKRLFLRNGKNL